MEEYIDEKKAAELVCSSVQTLRNDRCKSRGLPYYKIGRSVRYRPSDIHAYMARHKVVPDLR
jgi:predicted DNA-binding transcriptional regulator AlpA